MDDGQMRERSVYFGRKRSLFVGHWNGQSTNKKQQKKVCCDVLSFISEYICYYHRPPRVKHNTDFIFLYIKFSLNNTDIGQCVILNNND